MLVLSVVLFWGDRLFGVQSGRGNEKWDFQNGVHYTLFFNIFVFMQVQTNSLGDQLGQCPQDHPQRRQCLRRHPRQPPLPSRFRLHFPLPTHHCPDWRTVHQVRSLDFFTTSSFFTHWLWRIRCFFFGQGNTRDLV